jgi:hypothetical protein
MGTNFIDFRLPSGKTVRIREQNGEDDDKLTLVKDNKDGVAMNKFIAGIILELNGSAVVLQADDIKQWLLRDKYYLLFKSRRFSLGDQVFFDYTFQDGTMAPMEEDLAKYDFDYSTGTPPKKGQPDYNPLVAQSYPEALKVNLVLNSGKKVSYEYMTGEHEQRLLGRVENELTLNDKLRFRNLKLMVDGGGYQQIDRFNQFSARDMYEIRSSIEVEDSEFSLITECRNPKTNAIEKVSLLALNDFFFPVG